MAGDDGDHPLLADRRRSASRRRWRSSSATSPGSRAESVAVRLRSCYGLAVTGASTVRALRRHGYDVIVIDDHIDDAKRDLRRRARRRAARRARSTGSTPSSPAVDLVSPAPGVPETHARDRDRATRSDVPVRSEIELAYRWEQAPTRSAAATDAGDHRHRRQDDHDPARGGDADAPPACARSRAGNTDVPLVDALDDASSTRSSSSARSFRLAWTRAVPRRRRALAQPRARPSQLAPLDERPTRPPRRASVGSPAPVDVAIGFVDDPIVMRHLAARTGAPRHVRALDADYHLAERRAGRGPAGTIATIASMRRRLPHDITNALAASALVLEIGLGDARGDRRRRLRRSRRHPTASSRSASATACSGSTTRRRRRRTRRRRRSAASTRRADRRRAQQGARPVADGGRAATPPVGRGDRRGGRRDQRRVRRRTARSSRPDSMDAAVVAAADSARRGDAVRAVARLRQLRLVPDRWLHRTLVTTSAGSSPTWSAIEEVDAMTITIDLTGASTCCRRSASARAASRPVAERRAGGARAAAAIPAAARAGPGAARNADDPAVALGPPPVAYYVIVVVVAVFVMLGLVMVLSSSAATEVGERATRRTGSSRDS